MRACRSPRRSACGPTCSATGSRPSSCTSRTRTTGCSNRRTRGSGTRRCSRSWTATCWTTSGNVLRCSSGGAAGTIGRERTTGEAPSMTDIARDIDAAAAQLGATATPGAATSAAPASAALAGTEAPGLIATEDERYNATLVRRVDQHESLGYFWVRFDEEPTPFEPGQYMTIGVFVDGKIVQRPYSVASAPGVAGDTGYEFYLRLVMGGTFTPILWQLPVGHRMRMIGPKGKFLLEPDDDRTHLFISSGTGNAPFISMMRDMLAAGAPRRAVFLNGVSHARDLGYSDIVENW